MQVMQVQEKDGSVTPVIDKMMVTKIDPDFYNFSITEFDQGTFTFLQDLALQGDMPSKPYCYAINTRDCFWLNYFWKEAGFRLADRATNRAVVRSLLESGTAALKFLKANFSGRTGLRLMQSHKKIDALLNPEIDEDEGN